ncbi:MAG: hypothetical protein B7Z37_03675 [Verrucomicrobia bacterium 12-59-8]|nr:MAG: hypothetical protein B7Z37_03675 [Verrucomicrobia bacterium 12-59-8]
MNGNLIREGFVDFECWMASGSNGQAAEVHAGAAGELGVFKNALGLLPGLVQPTQGRLAEARLTLG